MECLQLVLSISVRRKVRVAYETISSFVVFGCDEQSLACHVGHVEFVPCHTGELKNSAGKP